MKQRAHITHVNAVEILDSRGNPTVETTLYTAYETATASVPSGASTGSGEAFELRDGDVKRYGGAGVRTAVNQINTIIREFCIGFPLHRQQHFDAMLREFDGTENLKRFGANAILSLSLAYARLCAHNRNQELYEYIAEEYNNGIVALPVPLANVINGGVHADSGLNVQEFFLIPNRRRYTLPVQIELIVRVYQQLKKQLHHAGYATSLGDEGGFAPHVSSHAAAFRQLHTAIEKCELTVADDMSLGIDVAASEFYNSHTGVYTFSIDKKTYTPASIAQLYYRWVERYGITIIEDPCSEFDSTGWAAVTRALGKKITLVGDDLFVTQAERLQQGIIHGLANAVLIKPNQVGTLSGMIETVALARAHNYKVIFSHRSGETNDAAIIDLAIGLAAHAVKLGAPARGERIAKYNRLLSIAQAIAIE